MRRSSRLWGVLLALLLASLAAAASQTPAEFERSTREKAQGARPAARVTPALDLLVAASVADTEDEIPASPFEPPGPPEGRPPASPPGLDNPPNPPGRPPDRPPQRQRGSESRLSFGARGGQLRGLLPAIAKTAHDTDAGPRPRKLRLSPERRRALRVHGQYLGAKGGYRAAIALAKRLGNR